MRRDEIIVRGRYLLLRRWRRQLGGWINWAARIGGEREGGTVTTTSMDGESRGPANVKNGSAGSRWS
jgi:hypothetical protein